MWQLYNHICELQQYGPKQLNGRLLLVRCRLTNDGTPHSLNQRHQATVIEMLMRLLRRQFGTRDLTFQVSASDILVVLLSRPVEEAIRAIQDVIAEIHRYMLGDGEKPRVFMTVDAVTITENGEISAIEVVGEDGTFKRSTLAAVDLPPIDARKLLVPESPRFSFSPVWDVRNMAVMTHYLRCHAEKSGHGDCTGYNVLHGGERSAFVADVDLKVLRCAEETLRPYGEGKIPFLLVWQLHVRTIEDHRTLNRYAETMAALSMFAHDRMVLELVGIEPDWPASRMQWALGAVRRFVTAVAVRQPLESAALPLLAGCGANNVTVDLSGREDSPDLGAQLDKFGAMAAKHNLAAVAENVGSRAVGQRAVQAGFRYVHLGYTGQGAEKPEPASRFERIEWLGGTGLAPAAKAADGHFSSKRSTMSQSVPGAAV